MADRTSSVKQRFKGADGVIILSPSHCASNIYFKMTNQSKKLQRLFQWTSVTQSRVSDCNKKKGPTLIQTNPLSLSHTLNCFSSSLAPPSLKQWLSIPMCSWIRSCERLKSSRRQFSTSAHIPTKTQTHMGLLFVCLLITTRGLHLVAPQSHWNKTGQQMRFSYRAAAAWCCCCWYCWPRRNFWETLGNFKATSQRTGRVMEWAAL